jgi:hypothetical protein
MVQRAALAPFCATTRTLPFDHSDRLTLFLDAFIVRGMPVFSHLSHDWPAATVIALTSWRENRRLLSGSCTGVAVPATSLPSSRYW